MIKEISNYIDSLGETLDWVLYKNRSLDPGEYYFYKNTGDPNSPFSLSCHFIVGKKGEIVNKENEEIDITQEVNQFIEETEFFKKLFLSRYVKSNKSLIEQIYTNNHFFIEFNMEKFDNLVKNLDTFNKLIKKYYSNFLHEKNLAKESNDVLALLHHLIEQVFSLKSRTNLKITIFFNLPLEIYQKLSEFYFKDRIYNKSNFVFENGEYGLTSFKITTNEKKTFVVPKSSFVQSFNYTDFGTAINLSIFEYILRMKEPKIPNPLPLFIFQDQLNSKVINTVRNTGYTSLREVFIELNDDHVRDLGNYYLLYWGKGKSIEVSDIDYVEKFRYKLENVNIYHLLQNKGDRTSISDIFEFESNVVNPLFFNLLITEKKKPSFHYFDDVDKFYSNKPHKIVANLKNYRYSFYEYIYKSKSEAISESLVLNIAISNVIDIIHSSKKLECQSYDWIAIQNILNILFSINQLFDKTNKNFGGRNMPSEIPKYFTQLNELVNDPDKNLEDDYHYAFCAGQLIYYLLAQSQSGEKKHSLVEPFINRTSVQAFNEQLIRVFNQYKHAISFNFRRFNRLFEQVIGYKPETSYKELSSAFFAGYFGENIFFQKQTDSTEGDLQ